MLTRGRHRAARRTLAGAPRAQAAPMVRTRTQPRCTTWAPLLGERWACDVSVHPLDEHVSAMRSRGRGTIAAPASSTTSNQAVELRRSQYRRHVIVAPPFRPLRRRDQDRRGSVCTTGIAHDVVRLRSTVVITPPGSHLATSWQPAGTGHAFGHDSARPTWKSRRCRERERRPAGRAPPETESLWRWGSQRHLPRLADEGRQQLPGRNDGIADPRVVQVSTALPSSARGRDRGSPAFLRVRPCGEPTPRRGPAMRSVTWAVPVAGAFLAGPRPSLALYSEDGVGACLSAAAVPALPPPASSARRRSTSGIRHAATR